MTPAEGAPISDDRGRTLRLRRSPRRIVSLVPSDTYTLLALGAGARLVGRTRYCVEPADVVDGIEAVGGTKDPDLDRVIALAPDLVVMNREENTRADADRLERAGLTILATMPRTLAAGAAQVARLARVLGAPTDEAKDRVRSAYRAMQAAELRRAASLASGAWVRTFVPIWDDPLMTANARTFMSDVLEHVGAMNVFADRERKYPLAADLGRAEPMTVEKVGDRDTRYPRVTWAEVVEHQPDLVLLPDEPHAFGEEDVARVSKLDIPAAASGRVLLVEGRGLMWPGLRSLEALSALADVVTPRIG